MTAHALLLLAALLFAIGLAGLLIRRSALGLFLAVEILFNAANLLFVAFARRHALADSPEAARPALAFVFMVFAVAAAEAAVGISLVLAIVRRRGTLEIDALSELKW